MLRQLREKNLIGSVFWETWLNTPVFPPHRSRLDVHQFAHSLQLHQDVQASVRDARLHRRDAGHLPTRPHRRRINRSGQCESQNGPNKSSSEVNLPLIRLNPLHPAKYLVLSELFALLLLKSVEIHTILQKKVHVLPFFSRNRCLNLYIFLNSW
jgi:hypothetical protein